MAEDQGALGSWGDFCHPFPDKQRHKNTLSPETETEQLDSIVGAWLRKGLNERFCVGVRGAERS